VRERKGEGKRELMCAFQERGVRENALKEA